MFDLSIALPGGVSEKLTFFFVRVNQTYLTSEVGVSHCSLQGDRKIRLSQSSSLQIRPLTKTGGWRDEQWKLVALHKPEQDVRGNELLLNAGCRNRRLRTIYLDRGRRQVERVGRGC